MEYRPLGRSGLRVSAIGLGSWLTYGRSVDESAAFACLSKAREVGINFFDTADVYAGGEAETVLGRWLSSQPRSDIVLATKVYFPVGDGPNDRGLSRKHIMEQCEASLRRLQVDYLDLYQCHRFDDTVPLEETLRALDDLITQGKVLYAGVSEWSGAQITEAVSAQKALGLRPLISNQPQYSLLARAIEDDVVPASLENGLGQVVWSPLAGGVLTGKYIPGSTSPAGSRGADAESNMFMDRLLIDEVLEAVQRLDREVASKLGISVGELSLAWLLHQPGISSAIVGATTVTQVEENAAAAGIALDAETLGLIEEIMGPFGRQNQP